jgi:RNA recognition motif-containing protein
MRQKLFIGGLPFSTSTEELRQLFEQVEGVDTVTVVTDRDTGQSRGFAFVEMATSEAADQAIQKFNGYALGGRTLKVERSKPSAPRGRDDSRGGFGGGRGRW